MANRREAGVPVRKASDIPEASKTVSDVVLRQACASFENTIPGEIVPVCRSFLPEDIGAYLPSTETNVFEIALSAFPVPAEDCTWEDILAAKSELQLKRWRFKRFLNTLSDAGKTPLQVCEEINFWLDEYKAAMRVADVKTQIGTMKTFINLAKFLETFKPSALGECLLSRKERKLALLETEAKADGKVCALLFDLETKIGKHS